MRTVITNQMKTIVDVPLLSPLREKLKRIGTTTRDAGGGVLRFDRPQSYPRECANLATRQPTLQ